MVRVLAVTGTCTPEVTLKQFSQLSLNGSKAIYDVCRIKEGHEFRYNFNPLITKLPLYEQVTEL
jgi:hypothetical protein